MLKRISFLLIIFSINTAFAEVMTCDVLTDLVSPDLQKQVQVTYDSRQVFTIDAIQNIKDAYGNSIITSQTVFSRTYEDPLNRGGYQVSYCNPDDSTVSEFNKNMYVNSNCVVSGKTDQVFFSFTFTDKTKNGEYSIDYLGEDIQSTKVSFDNCK